MRILHVWVDISIISIANFNDVGGSKSVRALESTGLMDGGKVGLAMVQLFISHCHVE